MADKNLADTNITISLSERLTVELARMARETHTTEDELVQRAIKGFVQAHRGSGIPRFARRLGPIAFAEDDPSAA